MPYVSKKQEGYFHTPEGKAKVGEKVVAEFDAASKGKHFAKGGTVKSPYRVISEHPTHFIVHDGKSQFPVAKAGLKPATIARIQRLAGDGGEGDDSNVVQPAAPSTVINIGQPPAPGSVDAAAGQNPDFGSGSVATPMMAPPMAPTAAERGFAASPPPPGAVDTAARSAQLANAEAGAPTYVKPALPGTVPAGQAAPMPAATPAGLPPLPAAPVYGTTSGPAYDQAAQAAVEGGQALGELGQRKAAVEAAYQAAEAQRFQQFQKDRGDATKLVDGAISDYKNTKVDPNDYWNNRTFGAVGGRIAAGIGMLLSGIGSGKSAAGGHPTENMALGIIQKGIADNIAAQRDNLNAKGNLVQMYRQKVGDLDTAESLAHAHALGQAASQLNEMADRAQNPIQAAAAKEAAAKLMAAKAEQIDRATWTTTQARDSRAMAQWQVKAQQQMAANGPAGIDKPITDKVTALTMTAGALGKVLDAADNRVAGGETPGALAGWGQTLSRIPGIDAYRGGSNWETTVNLAAGELGKIAKGGVGSEEEVKSLIALAPGPNDSEAQKHLWLDNVRKYTNDQKENMNQVFERQGHGSYIPYPEVRKPKSKLATDTKGSR